MNTQEYTRLPMLPLHRIVPLSYPPSYFRFNQPEKLNACFIGLDPYGFELIKSIPDLDFVWLGGKPLLPLNELLDKVSICGVGISLWGRKGNNYYGDPGKTKLYSACGLPVIMTDNTPYAKIIRETNAGIVIPYCKEELEYALEAIFESYDWYKDNVKKTWRYINADTVCKGLLG